MNSCMRCGVKLQHNYLVTVLVTAADKVNRMIVCLKCREVLSRKEEAGTKSKAPPSPDTGKVPAEGRNKSVSQKVEVA